MIFTLGKNGSDIPSVWEAIGFPGQSIIKYNRTQLYVTQSAKIM